MRSSVFGTQASAQAESTACKACTRPLEDAPSRRALRLASPCLGGPGPEVLSLRGRDQPRAPPRRFESRMGRIFETRKHTMFARWDRMAKQFTRIGKEIVIAVKAGGPEPANNPQLRRVIQNARAVNMPKDKVESA